MVKVDSMQRLYTTVGLFYSGKGLSIIPRSDNIQENAWHNSLDLSKLSDDEKRKILEYVAEKLSRRRVQEALGISRSTLWRMLKGQVGIDDGKLRVLLGLITEHEFREVLSSRKLLEAANILRPDGTVSYAVVMEILKKAVDDEYLKQLIIRFVVDNFREDVKKAIGLFPVSIVLHWDEGFEDFLKNYKKRKKIKREDTIEYYKKLFTENLKSKQLTPELVDSIINPIIQCFIRSLEYENVLN